MITSGVRCRYQRCAVVLLLGLVCSSTSWTAELSRISGTVKDAASGDPIPRAQVFIEQSLTRPVETVAADANGYYEFTSVIPGMVGVFAHADGFAFGGFSVLSSGGEHHEDRTIALRRPTNVSGQIVGAKKRPVSKAQVSGVVLIDGDRMVGIPLRKIRKFGFQVPTSNSRGNFTINRLPEGGSIKLKIVHPEYAQQAVPEIRVGSSDTKITLTEGVLVRGTVLSKGNNFPVPGAPIIFHNKFPPKDTTIAQAGPDGVYMLRLRPGEYFYRSEGARYTSTSTPQIVVSGEYATQQIDLFVAGKGILKGKVLDAITEEGVVGVRVVLKIEGRDYKYTSTDSQGGYQFSAPEGRCTVRLGQSAGYLPSATAGFSVSLRPEQTNIAPTIWLKAVPTYSLEVLDANKAPVEGAVVQVLHPQQIGWRSTDEDGLVSISMAALPEKGIVIGYVDHPTANIGTVFKIDPARADDAIVELTALRAIRGRVLNEKSKSIEGQIVTCSIGDADLSSPVTLWKSVTDSDGTFSHPGVVEGLSLIYTARSPDNSGDQVDSPAFYTASEASQPSIPALILETKNAGESLRGKRFPWRNFQNVDEKRSAIDPKSMNSVVVFTNSARAAIMLDSLENSQQFLNVIGAQFVLMIDDPTALNSESIPIYKGKPPASADVYIISSDQRVLFESIEMPTYAAIRNVLQSP